MHYIIDNTLLYIIDEGTLKLKNDSSDETYKLTPILNRLLTYILQNRGKIIHKDEFLNEIWEKHGVEGSVNTLTQYLSNLRKALRDFIPDKECIITYPRQGYAFSSEITVEEYPTQNTKKDTTNYNKALTMPTLPMLKLSLLIILLISLVTISVYLTLNNFTKSKITPFFLYEFQDCPVYTLVKLNSDIVRETNIRYAEKIIEKHNIKCSSNTAFYLSVNRGAEHGISGNVMLARCTDDRPKACISYQYSRW